ncbi:MAG: hypothetical protein MJ009_02160 [Paludibacteraceae bacterium]|nr:hypothetical protein [Paludibacteraceae bacterium]
MKKLSLLLTCITLCVLCGCKKQGEPYSPENSKAVEYVSDCIGNKYPVVKIGNQLWMAENLKCDKYDTESESFGKDVVCYKLSDELLKEAELKRTEKKESFSHFGYLYNWHTTVGVGGDTEIRQGICPNGYHVPTMNEWNELINFCGGYKNALNKLKSKTEEWYDYGYGTDEYGFNMLPAGFDGSALWKATYFWSSTSISDSNAYGLTFKYFYNKDHEFNNFLKDHSFSVRCVKNQ